ncbi:hypothetical protein ACFZAU_30845, partial [Streptomyces sp. NPDC008238]
VKVMDFGIVRAVGDAGLTMTQTAAVIGTARGPRWRPFRAQPEGRRCREASTRCGGTPPGGARSARRLTAVVIAASTRC